MMRLEGRRLRYRRAARRMPKGCVVVEQPNSSGRSGGRTRTGVTSHGILSPVRLPIPPSGPSASLFQPVWSCPTAAGLSQRHIRVAPGVHKKSCSAKTEQLVKAGWTRYRLPNACERLPQGSRAHPQGEAAHGRALSLTLGKPREGWGRGSCAPPFRIRLSNQTLRHSRTPSLTSPLRNKIPRPRSGPEPKSHLSSSRKLAACCQRPLVVAVAAGQRSG